jgi:16S rRNA (guanine1207-N2)-methyltransferase
VGDAAAAGGAEVTRWSRRRTGAAPWPPQGRFDLVALRQPRAREELEMLLHVAADRLRPGGRLLVYGANDEGIKSAPNRIAPLFGQVGTLATGGHARLLGARRPAEVGGVRATMGDWRRVSRLRLPWQVDTAPPKEWVSWPGIFAHGRLDEGTALLLRHLPVVGPATGEGEAGGVDPGGSGGHRVGARVLDWGAGSGFLGAGVLAAAPGAQVTLVELDALAAAAAKENVTGARVVQGDGWEALGHLAPFDVLVANPPYHRGKEESMSEVVRLLAGIPGGMAPGGIARLVVQRRLPLEGVLSRAFRSVSVVADEGPFRVWEGRR